MRIEELFEYSFQGRPMIRKDIVQAANKYAKGVETKPQYHDISKTNSVTGEPELLPNGPIIAGNVWVLRFAPLTNCATQNNA